MAARLAKLWDRPKPLRIGSEAPDFDAKSTPYSTNAQPFSGDSFNFYSYLGGKWAELFSHPCDFTPVCTTEIASFAEKQDEFNRRDVRLIGLSIGNLKYHKEWIAGIHSNVLKDNHRVKYPIVADEKGVVAWKYHMVDKEEHFTSEEVLGCNPKLYTIRSVFIISPAKKIRAILSYPMQTGRNIDEIIRVIDSLQAHEDQGEHIVTPANWNPGDDVAFRPTDPKILEKKWKDIIDKYDLPYIKFKRLPKKELKAFRQDHLRSSISELSIETSAGQQPGGAP